VINCAGLSRGSLQQLEQANVCFAEKLARASKQAGVRHFVQVSSFSVFGRVDQIGPASALRPDSAYGCSKLLAERRLAALAADGFEVTILRLPFMFSAEHPGLLRPLLRGMRRFRIMPARVGGQPLKRSMITFDDAAALLVGLVWAPHRGVLSAADPEPLALSRLAELARHHWGCSIALLPTPRALASVIGLVSPRIGNSLLKSSVLEASINYLGGERGSRVENELAAYFGGRDGPIAPL
jgi:UDP-glucose 4-epimerase